VTGHVRWTRSKRVVNEDMVQYVQGYILAMEDILKDIENMHYDAEDSSVEYTDGFHHALEGLQFRITESLDSAQRTLDTVAKKADDGE
jgi:hypothetical protein